MGSSWGENSVDHTHSDKKTEIIPHMGDAVPVRNGYLATNRVSQRRVQERIVRIHKAVIAVLNAPLWAFLPSYPQRLYTPLAANPIHPG